MVVAFGDDKPFLIDLTHGIVGKFIKEKKTDDKEGYRKIVYRPVNGVLKKTFDVHVPKEAISDPIRPPDKDISGVFSQYVFVTEVKGGERPLLDKLDAELEKGIDRLQERREEEKFEKNLEKLKDKNIKEGSSSDSKSKRRKRSHPEQDGGMFGEPRHR